MPRHGFYGIYFTAELFAEVPCLFKQLIVFTSQGSKPHGFVVAAALPRHSGASLKKIRCAFFSITPAA